MLLIVDGYNLLFHEAWRSQGDSLQEQREHMILRLSDYKHIGRCSRLMLVFDGKEWPGPYNQSVYQRGLEVIYSNLPGGADEKIVRLCQDHYRATVVTADRKLGQAAQKRHATVVLPDQFLRTWEQLARLRSKEQKTSLLSPEDGDWGKWLEMYGLEEEIEIPPLPVPPRFKKKK
jgi:predicted RNA-binding protein with PIN domain